MMFKICKISCFLIAVGLLICPSNDVWAQNPAKVDMAKTGGKFSDWVQKQHENYQDQMEKLSESQFGTAIGSGISAVKDAKKFVTDEIGTVTDFVNDVNKEINDFKQSNTYKSAMLAKDIALKEQELERLKKERDQKISQMKEDIEIEKAALAEKIKQAQENIKIGTEILSPEENGSR